MKAYSISCPVYGTAPAPRLKSGFDAARTTDGNRKHWANADGLAPVSQVTPAVRRILRNRARYECQNNSYARGVVRTLVADTIGTGARLQMLTGDVGLDTAVEELWRHWAAAADWSLTSRVMCGVEVVGGEGFGVFRDSKKLVRLGLPVSLDLRLIEPDQVADPFGTPVDPTGDDGVICDADGEVEAYRILKAHPGDNREFAPRFVADVVSADDVIHWFQPERPGQLRGVTPLTPALPIFSQLRRYGDATLTAAEIAAMLAGVMELPSSPLPTDDEEPVTYDTMDTIELVRGMLVTVPGGGKITQFRPEQPTTNYPAFVNAKLREAGRALNMPFGKVAGDHSGYNYSSGRMDDAPYWHDRDIQRAAFEAKFFDPFFYRWCELAMVAVPGLRKYRGEWWRLSHVWHYDAKPVTDPTKDASADELNLTNGSDTLAAIAARDGTTVEALIAQRKREKELFEAAGLPLPPWMVGNQVPARGASDAPAKDGPVGA